MKLPRFSRTTTVIISLIVALIAPSSPPAVAGADTPESNRIQALIDAHLRTHPGGRQINATEVSYGNGTFIITFVVPYSTLPAPDCPAGSFCF